jgi:hypothetical protein
VLDQYRYLAWPTVALLTIITIGITLAQALRPSVHGTQVQATSDGTPTSSDGSDAGHARRISNLPPRNPSFVGRRALLAMMSQGFESASKADGNDLAYAPLLVLHGMPGLGKTQTASEFAHRAAATRTIRWWVQAERPADILASIIALGMELDPHSTADDIRPGDVVSVLNQRSDWLLIFDNAERPADVVPYLPTHGGWLIVTSRNHSWGALGETYQLPTLDDDEASEFLAARIGGSKTELKELSQALGGLPLALEQAAAYIEKTRISIQRYIGLLHKDIEPLLSRGDLAFYSNRADVVFGIALERLRQRSSAAAEMLEILAFLGADEIPEHFFSRNSDLLPRELRRAYSDELLRADTVGELLSSSLISLGRHGFNVHRLTQAGARRQLTPTMRIARLRVALGIVYAALGGAHRASIVAQVSYDRIEDHAIAAAELAEPHAALHREACVVFYRVGQNFEAMAEESRLARPILDKALAMAQSSFGPKSPEVAAILATLACLSLKFNKRAEMAALMRRAVSIVEETGEAAFGDSPENFLQVFKTPFYLDVESSDG